MAVRKKQGTTKPAARSGKKTARTRRASPGRVLRDLLLLSWVGRVLLVSLLIAVLLGVNLLISANQYDLFFIMAGIELMAAALVFWLRMALRRG